MVFVNLLKNNVISELIMAIHALQRMVARVLTAVLHAKMLLLQAHTAAIMVYRLEMVNNAIYLTLMGRPALA
jgi:hypothetical protein